LSLFVNATDMLRIVGVYVYEEHLLTFCFEIWNDRV